MKKMILSSIFAVAFIAIAGYGVTQSVNKDVKFSNLLLREVEALGQTSGEDIVITCGRYEGRCWFGFPTPSGLHFNCFFTGLQKDNCVYDPFGIP